MPAIDGAWGKEHQAEVPEPMQQEDRQQNCAWLELVEPRQKVELGRNPENQRAGQEIDGEDIHGRPPVTPAGARHWVPAFAGMTP